jgi:hypothetical protein
LANRFQNPFPQFFNSTPAVYASGTLTFYASGTSTPLATYSDRSLSSANDNPLTLNSAGRPSVAIFLQDLAYKVVLKDSSGTEIWSADPVYSSDFSAQARFNSGSGSPNGSVAGTAGSASADADVYWDFTNNVLYVCTTTGTSVTAVWTAVNSSSATPVIPVPQGYLTPTSGTPVISSDVSAGTSVYYTPFVGNLCPIYNGSVFLPFTFTEKTLTLAAQHVADTHYDVFAFLDSGVVTIGTGPAWSTNTAGSGARGTGPGTTQLTRVTGLWTNAVSMTARNGSTTYTVAANQGTYLGTILIDGTNGQITCHTSAGQTRRFAIWNAFNRQPITLRVVDSTASWSYTTNTIRQSNGATGNVAKALCGLAEESIAAEFSQAIELEASDANTTADSHIGIGVNSTTTMSGRRGRLKAVFNITSAPKILASISAGHIVVPALGLQNINCLETCPDAGLSNVHYGTSDYMLMTVSWRG